MDETITKKEACCQCECKDGKCTCGGCKCDCKDGQCMCGDCKCECKDGKCTCVDCKCECDCCKGSGSDCKKCACCQGEKCECPDCKCKCDCKCDDCGKEQCDCKECEECKSEPQQTATGKSDSDDLKLQLEQEKSARMQVLADFINFRKRVEKEREEMHVSANKTILFQLIDVIDDFDRAVHLEQDKISTENDFYKGVKIIRKKLGDLLSAHSIDEIKVKEGDTYDPATMEAVSTAPVSDHNQANKVIHLVGKGYINRNNGRVFKPVKVVIGKK